MFSCLFVFVALVNYLVAVDAWADDSERVSLADVAAITLHQGKYTTGRRSAGVPQLKCVGGTAGCSAFVPTAVQCRNVGSDGFDAQWECKTDMDSSYRFGKIQVSCEGYDHPNDPYVLRGSCGLEYTIDYTEEGRSKKNYWGGSSSYSLSKRSSWDGSWFFFILIVGVIGFIIYKMGRANTDPNNQGPPPPRRDHGFRGPGSNPGQGGQSPPPYGFKPEYTSQGVPPSYDDATSSHDAGYGSQSSSYSSQTNTRTEANNQNGPGFWSGMGLGGMAGYLFGRRNNHGWNTGYGRGYGSGYGAGWGSGYGSGWGSGYGGGRGWGSSWGGSSARHRSSGPSSSSSSRTTSGFGGTSRR